MNARNFTVCPRPGLREGGAKGQSHGPSQDGIPYLHAGTSRLTWSRTRKPIGRRGRKRKMTTPARELVFMSIMLHIHIHGACQTKKKRRKTHGPKTVVLKDSK